LSEQILRRELAESKEQKALIDRFLDELEEKPL